MKASPFQVGEITVQETTDFLVCEEYVAVTIERFGRAQIGAEGLENYTTGLPFPLLDPADRQAALRGDPKGEPI